MAYSNADGNLGNNLKLFSTFMMHHISRTKTYGGSHITWHQTNKHGEECFGTDTKAQTDRVGRRQRHLAASGVKGQREGGREGCGNLLNSYAWVTATQNITQHYSHNSCKRTFLYWHTLLLWTGLYRSNNSTVKTLPPTLQGYTYSHYNYSLALGSIHKLTNKR